MRAYHVLTDGSVGTVTASPSVLSGRRPGLITAAAIVVLVVGGIVVWQTSEPPPAPAPEAVAEPEDPILRMPTGPSIAVLPFDNLSGDEQQEYFSDGLTEDIITALSRFGEIRVVSRNSTFQYKGQPVDVRQVGEELGADYVLEGSVRRAQDTIRVTAQLLDSRDGTHTWAESFDRDLSAAGIFDVQDAITAAVVSIISGHSGVIARQLVADAAGQRTEDLGAYECTEIRARSIRPDDWLRF